MSNTYGTQLRTISGIELVWPHQPLQTQVHEARFNDFYFTKTANSKPPCVSIALAVLHPETPDRRVFLELSDSNTHDLISPAALDTGRA